VTVVEDNEDNCRRFKAHLLRIQCTVLLRKFMVKAMKTRVEDWPAFPNLLFSIYISVEAVMLGSAYTD